MYESKISDARWIARVWGIGYVKQNFPETAFVEIPGLDHAEYALLHPAAFAGLLLAFWECQGDSNNEV